MFIPCYLLWFCGGHFIGIDATLQGRACVGEGHVYMSEWCVCVCVCVCVCNLPALITDDLGTSSEPTPGHPNQGAVGRVHGRK